MSHHEPGHKPDTDHQNQDQLEPETHTELEIDHEIALGADSKD